MSLRPPVAKLPLNVRKNLRDDFDAKIPELQERMLKLGFPNYSFQVNVNEVYAYADYSYPKDNTGRCFVEYFDGFITHVERFTKEGKDTEAVEGLKKAAPKNSVSLAPDEEQRFTYNGCDIRDGAVRLLFAPSSLGSNIQDAAGDLPKVVDAAIDAQGGSELPIAIRRGIAERLDAKFPALQEKLLKILGKKFTLEPDVAKNYEALRVAGHSELDRIPELTYLYFEAACEKIEYKGFEKDDMLQEAFNEAADKAIIRFEVIERLPDGMSYGNCVFEDGEFKLQTDGKGFARNISQVADNVMERL